MKSLFKGYYQPTPEQFKTLWEEGTFVFDTNVLLNLYRYKVDSRDEVLNVIKRIEDRVWVPYQVGLEFHRNRLSVLGEQNSSLSTIKNSIRDSISSIEKKCRDLDLDKRHSEIKTSTFIERFRDLSESVINELDEIKAKKLTNDVDDDVVLTELTELFSTAKGSLGTPPKDQNFLEEIYRDGEFRAKNKIPPSFEDIIEAQKNKSAEEYYAFEGLNYKYGYGDLIVWKQIIEFAKKNQKKNIVFITDDKKEDWMRIINSHGKKTISARPELVSEIFKEAGVENFYIYDTKSFLDYSKEYLDIEIQDETITDIASVSYEAILKAFEDINKNYTSKSLNNFYKEVFLDYEVILGNWLSSRYEHLHRTKNVDFEYEGVEFDGSTSLIDSKRFVSDDEFMRIEYYILDKIESFLVFDKHFIKRLHLILVFEEVDIDNIEAASNYFKDANFRSRIEKFLKYNFTTVVTFAFLNTNPKELIVFNEYEIL